MFNKKSKSSSKAPKEFNKKPFYKNNKFRYSTMSSILILVFIVCLIAVNVLATFLSDRFTAFNIDLTSSNDYSISEKNENYIKNIDKDIDIIVTCTEDYYTGGEYASYLANNYYYADESNGKYFQQTVKLLKNYQKLNDRISVKFLDSTSPEFQEYYDAYSDEITDYGQIIVSCKFTNSYGEEQTRHKVLSVTDIYSIDSGNSSDATSTDTSYSYTINGSTLEQNLTSALYFVEAEQQDYVYVVTGYNCTDISDYAFVKELEANNYIVKTITDFETDKIPSNATMVVLAAPTLDLSESDVNKLDEFLLGKAQSDSFDYGKSLIYFASSVQHDTPNLDAFLSEWGFNFEEGTIYETDSSSHLSSSSTAPFMDLNTESDYAPDLSTNYYYCSDGIRPMTMGFESRGKYYTYDILNTKDTCVVQPRKASSSWSADDSAQNSYTAMGLSRFTTKNSTEDGARYSSVLSIASLDFISDAYSTISYLGNSNLTKGVINSIANRDTDGFEIDTKIIDTATFEPSAMQSSVIFAVCAFVIPIALLIVGIVMFVRRKRR